MSGISEFIQSLQAEISASLLAAATAYYNTGIGRFHELRKNRHLEYQPAVGNLTVSVELLLKAILAKKALRHLYTDMPSEAQLMLTYPESLPDSFRARQFANELRCFSYGTIELDRAISYFYHFFPGTKQELKPYLSLMAATRNVSVHGALPSFQRYDLERVAFVSTCLFRFVSETNLFDGFYVFFDKETQEFVKDYQEERIRRVKDAIAAAKTRSIAIEHYGFRIAQPSEWECYVIKCPICGSDALAYGDTTESADEEIGPMLWFSADSFSCEECGLKLNDSEELKLAGVAPAYDRTVEFSKWPHDMDWEAED
jgi:hypothetical protein